MFITNEECFPLRTPLHCTGPTAPLPPPVQRAQAEGSLVAQIHQPNPHHSSGGRIRTSLKKEGRLWRLSGSLACALGKWIGQNSCPHGLGLLGAWGNGRQCPDGISLTSSAHAQLPSSSHARPQDSARLPWSLGLCTCLYRRLWVKSKICICVLLCVSMSVYFCGGMCTHGPMC